MDSRQIIMNYTVAPNLEDIEVLAASILEALPDELSQFCENLTIQVEDIVDEVTEDELELEDAFDLLAFYKSGKEISPGVERKTANNDDSLILYRRAILDMWCETGEDLTALIRQVMIEELARNHDFSEEEIQEMNARHYQGML